MSGKIIQFSQNKSADNRKVVGFFNGIPIKDDYYITVDELAELVDKKPSYIMAAIKKGKFKIDKINGDLLIPMDIADEYIDKVLSRKLMAIRLWAIVIGVILCALAIMAIVMRFGL